MNFLFDTQPFLWCLDGDERLSAKAMEVFLNNSNTIYFSAISYLEICLKIANGKLQLASDWKKDLDKQMSLNAVKWLKLKKEHMARIVELPQHHKDEVDRVLICQALEEQCVLVTPDNHFGPYGVKTLW